MEGKPTIRELEDLLNDDTKHSTLLPSGGVIVEDASSPDVIIKKLRMDLDGKNLRIQHLEKERAEFMAWVSSCPFIQRNDQRISGRRP